MVIEVPNSINIVYVVLISPTRKLQITGINFP